MSGTPALPPLRLDGTRIDKALRLRVYELVEPCPICGSAGACAFDSEGRALIHTNSELPEGNDA